MHPSDRLTPLVRSARHGRPVVCKLAGDTKLAQDLGQLAALPAFNSSERAQHKIGEGGVVGFRPLATRDLAELPNALLVESGGEERISGVVRAADAGSRNIARLQARSRSLLLSGNLAPTPGLTPRQRQSDTLHSAELGRSVSVEHTAPHTRLTVERRRPDRRSSFAASSPSREMSCQVVMGLGTLVPCRGVEHTIRSRSTIQPRRARARRS